MYLACLLGCINKLPGSTWNRNIVGVKQRPDHQCLSKGRRKAGIMSVVTLGRPLLEGFAGAMEPVYPQGGAFAS